MKLLFRKNNILFSNMKSDLMNSYVYTSKHSVAKQLLILMKTLILLILKNELLMLINELKFYDAILLSTRNKRRYLFSLKDNILDEVYYNLREYHLSLNYILITNKFLLTTFIQTDENKLVIKHKLIKEESLNNLNQNLFLVALHKFLDELLKYTNNPSLILNTVSINQMEFELYAHTNLDLKSSYSVNKDTRELFFDEVLFKDDNGAHNLILSDWKFHIIDYDIIGLNRYSSLFLNLEYLVTILRKYKISLSDEKISELFQVVLVNFKILNNLSICEISNIYFTHRLYYKIRMISVLSKSRISSTIEIILKENDSIKRDYFDKITY